MSTKKPNRMPPELVAGLLSPSYRRLQEAQWMAEAKERQTLKLTPQDVLKLPPAKGEAIR